MQLKSFIHKLKTNPKTISFTETMQVIDTHFSFVPTAFVNGEINNNAGENNGSCKLFVFAIHQNLTKEETLFCFGEHYKSVLEDINGNSHQNIRNFMKTGFDGLSFGRKVLTSKM